MREKFSKKTRMAFHIVSVILLLVIFFAACSNNAESENMTDQQTNTETDRPASDDDTIISEPEITEYEYTEQQSIIIAPNDNRRICGIGFVPTGNVPMHTVILCHGFGGNIFSVYSQARYFASKGYACFLYDFCGGSMFSMSSGNFSEMTIDSEIDDLNVILDYVSSVSYVDADNIYIYGYSLGAFVAVSVAADRKEDVAGLILAAPAFSLADEAAIYYQTGRYFIMAGEKFIENAYSYYGKIDGILSSCEEKTLILHGNKDKLVDISYSERAVEIMPNAFLMVVEGAGHNYDFEDVDFIQEKSAEFLASFKE